MQHTADNQRRDDSDKEGIPKLPEPLKTGIEALSGLSMEDVHVHYDSSLPAQVEALAYTQGTDIYVAPGQEQYLAHEAWHVVQQKQGRVKPTLQARGRAINDEPALEREADVMGQKAAKHSFTSQQFSGEQPLIDGLRQQLGTEHSVSSELPPFSTVIQRMWGPDEVRGGVTYKMWTELDEGSTLKDGFWYRLKQPSGSWDKKEDVQEVGEQLPEEEKGKDEKAKVVYHDVPGLVEVFGKLGYKRSDSSDIFMSWGASEQNVPSGWKLHAGCAQGQWVLVATEVTKLLQRLRLAHKVMVVEERLLSGQQRNKLLTVWSSEDQLKMKTAIEAIDAALTKLGVSVQDAAVPGHIMAGPTNRVAVRYGGNQPVTEETLTKNGIGFKKYSKRLLSPTSSELVYDINPENLGGSLKGGQVPIYEGSNGGLRAYDKQTNPALMLQTDRDENPILYPDLRDNPLQSDQVGVPFPKEFSAAGGVPYVTLDEDQWSAYEQSLNIAPLLDEKRQGSLLYYEALTDEEWAEHEQSIGAAPRVPRQEEKQKAAPQPLAPPPTGAPDREEKQKGLGQPLVPPSASTPDKDAKLVVSEQAQLAARKDIARLCSSMQDMLTGQEGEYRQLWTNYQKKEVLDKTEEIMKRVERFYTALIALGKQIDTAKSLNDEQIRHIWIARTIMMEQVEPALAQAQALEKA